MRRSDGKPKLTARRAMPEYTHGFRDNPQAAVLRSRAWAQNGSLGNFHTVVSLFSGCGGMDLGFTGGFRSLGADYPELPFRVIYAADNSADALATYKLNLGDDAHSVDLSCADMSALPYADVLTGGFPCQDFSSSGTKSGLAGRRGQLYRALVDYMESHQPLVVVGENVPHLARLQKGAFLDTIVADMESAGYRFDVWELYAPDFGIPQSRRRLFLVGVRADLSGAPERPPTTHSHKHSTIDDALSDLEGISDETVPNQSQYFVTTRARSGGGQGDHTNQEGRVAYCIRANARGRIQFHYSLPRRLTVRECARLQSFPDEFVFPFSTQRNRTLIGNAVPPALGYHVAKSVHRFLPTTGGLSTPSDPPAA